MKLRARPEILWGFINEKRCAMCKHTEIVAHITSEFKGVIAPQWAFHYQETHGIPPEYIQRMTMNMIYGRPIGEGITE